MTDSRISLFSGRIGCFVLAACILVYSTLFLQAEEQIPVVGYMLFACLCVLVGARLGLQTVLSRMLATHELLWKCLMALVTLALIVIFREDHYALFLLGTIMLYAVAVLGLNVQLGYAGVINFSAASFFGIGGYTAAMMLANHTVHPLVALVLGGVFAALAGCILLLPVLRTSGHYSALVTMAFALLFRTFLEVCPFFGGPQGIPVEPMSLFGHVFSDDLVIGETSLSFYVSYDLFALFLLCLAFILVQRLERSWLGLSMDAVRGDEIASACFGISIARWKIVAFTTGNFLSGLAGALYGMMLAYVSPANFAFTDSLLFLSILLLGGMGNLWGVILATSFVVVVPEKFQMIQEYRYLIYAALVLLMIVFRPMGLLPRKSRIYIPGGEA